MSSFTSFFCSNIAASKTSFWARPLKTGHSKLNACDVCSLEALEIFSGCVPEETHIDADYDWKTTQSSKGKTDICLCSNCQIISLGFRFSA